ncbi:hypothetical protein PU02_0443 [Bartonella ancashensis]|uniref:Uncharacterized protein n=1 Tax=Bartonella ancashensis TaxID=1318743 RepID=A0A0M4LG09_9HYPH|nr:hypothetical protein PU02_0443 [Bartonella ancashensis]
MFWHNKNIFVYRNFGKSLVANNHDLRLFGISKMKKNNDSFKNDLEKINRDVFSSLKFH